MACLCNLSTSEVVANLAPSPTSPSLSPANNKRSAALQFLPSLQTSRFSLHINDNHRRRTSIAWRGIPVVATRPDPYGLVHIAAGDLLRAEVAAGTENGKRAKEYMEKGKLVPDEIVVMMVKERLLQSDTQENGWLLDGYPRSLSQAKALEDLGIRPVLFILLDVSEDILVERVVGRRLDPVTGRIYHLKFSPPENEEIAGRLTQRFDDTEEKVKLRLQTHHQNVEAVLAIYKDITFHVNGDAPREEVFDEIDNALSSILEVSPSMAAGTH